MSRPDFCFADTILYLEGFLVGRVCFHNKLKRYYYQVYPTPLGTYSLSSMDKQHVYTLEASAKAMLRAEVLGQLQQKERRHAAHPQSE